MKFKLFLFILTLALATSQTSNAAYLEYTLSDKTYTVDGLIGNIPYIGNDPATQQRLRQGGEWNFTLEQDDSLHDSIPAYDYKTGIRTKSEGQEVPPYLQIIQNRRAERRFDAWTQETLKDATLVYAWIREGTIHAAAAVAPESKSSANLQLDIAQQDGQLRIFALKNGKLLKPRLSEQDQQRIVVVEGDLEALEKIRITNKLTTKDGETFLHFAAMAGQSEVIRYLVESKKQNANATTKEEGNTPLILAATNGHHRAVETLLQLGADPNKKNVYTESPLMLCAKQGRTEIFKLIAESGGSFIDNRSELLTYITASGTPIAFNSNNLENGTYSAVLLIAAEKGYGEIVSYILGSDTATNQLTANKQIASYIVHRLAQANEVPVALQTLERTKPKKDALQNGKTFMHSFARFGTEEELEQIFAFDPSLEAIDEDGLAPLHIAAHFGNAAAIRWFVKKGVDLNAPPYLESSPLWFAISRQKKQAILTLLELGASPNSPATSKHPAPLEMLITQSKFELAQTFLEKGASWPTPSAKTARILLKLMQADNAELLSSYHQAHPQLLESLRGIAPETLMNYYQSQRCLEWLSEIKGDPSIAQMRPSQPSIEIDQAVLRGREINYPKELYQNYGPLNFPVTFVLGSEGRCILPKTPDYVPDSVQRFVEKQMSKYVLHPEERKKHELLSILQFQIDLPSKIEQAFDTLNGVDLKNIQTKPTVKKKTTPTYPYGLLLKKIPGKVVVEFILTKNGEVLYPRAVSYTHPAFISAAIECIKKTTFTPAMHNGKPVAARIRIPIQFNP